MTEENQTDNDSLRAIIMQPLVRRRIGIVAAIILSAMLIYVLLLILKPKPKEKEQQERSRTFKVYQIKKMPAKISFTGFGTAQPIRQVDLAAEVKGRIVYCKPELKNGIIVPAEELLVKVDPADYEIALQQAQAEIKQLDANIARIKQLLKDDQERLKVIDKDLELAKKNFVRVKSLADKEATSESILDQTEQVVMQKKNVLLALKSLISQRPIEMDELQARKITAMSRAKLAELNLKRCEIRSPFAGRIGDLSVEAGQFVNMGAKIMHLADDRVLEIPVSVDSIEAIRLGLGSNNKQAGSEYLHWFSGVEKLTAELEWVDAPESYRWAAKTIRIEDFDEDTRTVKIVVRPLASAAAKAPYPLVAGMFCRVYLQGQEIPDAIRLPRTAIQFGGRIFVLKDGRLSERKVEILHRSETCLIVREGLAAGEMVVTEKMPFGIVEGMKIKAVVIDPYGPEEADKQP